MVLYECLNDKATIALLDTYQQKNKSDMEMEFVDAAVMNSIDEFSVWFSQWIGFAPHRSSTRFRVLVVWHAHFLSLACQQMLRRSLEQRSFRCRVFFHIEEPTLQKAILSRCIVRCIPNSPLPTIHIQTPIDTSLWENPLLYETELKRSQNK